MPNIVRFDCFEAHLDSGQLYKRGLRIKLRDQSFSVLASLLEHPGRVVTREELRRRLWRDEVFVDFDNNLNIAIARLREVLGDSAEHPRFIETLPKHGYRFMAAVDQAAGSVAARRPKLLVLPFVNLSGDPAQEYFSDAMTDEIITAVAGVTPEHLAVIARTTAMHYKGSHNDIAQIGREVGADYVVEGGVRRVDERVAVNLQLIQVSDQTHLLANRYDVAMPDIFSLHTSIAQAIADHIPGVADSLHAGTRHGVHARRKPTEDLVAYNLYLKGRYWMCKSGEQFGEAKSCFEEAVVRDPRFALAYDALGEFYWWAGFTGRAAPREAFSMGLWAALRAIEIDNTLAETHALIGQFRKELDYNWSEVRREMALALQLNPSSPRVRFRSAISGLMPLGRLEETAAELETVLEMDPLDLDARCWLGAMLWLGRHYDRAVEQLRLALQVDPDFPLGHLGLGQTLCMEHKFDEAIASLRRAVELYCGAPLALCWLGLALAQGGNVAEARSLLARLHTVADQAYVPGTCFAWIHLGLGEIDEAFAWMDRAIEQRDPMMVPIKSYAFLDPIRSDPRFALLLRKMNLADS